MGLTRSTVLWMARESTYGTDPAMTGSDALLVYDFDIDIKGEKLERPVLRDTISKLSHVIGVKEVEMTFKTELKGAGLSGTQPVAPEWAVPLSGCAFNTGVASGTAITYSLVSDEDSMKSLSVYAFLFNKNKHKITGCRGSVKFTLQAGQYGVAEWTFMGLYNAVISETTPTFAGLGTNQPPVCYNASFQIGGFSPVTSQAEIDMANEVQRRDDLNATAGVDSFRLTNRTPTLSFDADAVAESSNPFWGDWVGDVLATFAVNVGTNAGNRIEFSGYFQYDSNKYGDQDGIRKYDCVASLVSSTPDTSNDELKIKAL